MIVDRIVQFVVVFTLVGCTSTPSSVPGYLEPHHHVRFQNGYVRVMETRLEPGEKTLPHSHPIDTAVVFLTAGQMLIENDDGTSHASTLERDGVAFGPSPIVHRAGNIGEEIVRVVTVEIFSQPPHGHRMSLPASAELLLENSKVRMQRIRVAPGESTTLADATPLVVVAVSEGIVASGGRRSTLTIGGVRWHDSGALELHSDGRAEFEAVIVILEPRAPADSLN